MAGSEDKSKQYGEQARPWIRVGLTDDEYGHLTARLGRTPNPLELELVGAMWSEHCSYKSSRRHLSKLPSSGPQILVGPGENAGVIDLGGPVAAALRCESHNHPSSIDPYKGAASGAGGILRDILAVGARPALLAGSVRVGPLTDPHNEWILTGAAAGMADFAAGTGVPAFQADVFAGDGYRAAPLVNVLCAGFVQRGRVFLGRAEGVGNLVFLVGALTGPDGVHAASASSQALHSDAGASVDVPGADPRLKRRIIEACLEIMAADLLVGINDLGAAGLTSASVETAARAGLGMDLDLDQVPCREPGLSPHEIMLSETQERMLLIVRADGARQVEQILHRWELPGAQVGRVADHGQLRLTAGGRVVAAVTATVLTNDAPLYDRPAAPPADLAERWQLPPLPGRAGLTDASAAAAPAAAGTEPAAPDVARDWAAWLTTLLAGPNLAAARWLYAGRDGGRLLATGAAALPVPGTGQTMVTALAGNGRLTWLDPQRGAALAVAEAGRRTACAGARPLALTNCLNLGSPERPEIMWEFTEIIAGLGAAAAALDVPVSGGNVSLYNERDGIAVYPTPLVGVIGVAPAGGQILDRGWQAAGDRIILLGGLAGSLAGSEYGELTFGRAAGRPLAVDFDLEARLWALLIRLHADNLLAAAGDVALGGLAVALARACGAARGAPLGAVVDLPLSPAGESEPATLLFGEGPGRVIVSAAPAAAAQVLAAAAQAAVPAWELGVVGGDQLQINLAGGPLLTLPVAQLPAAAERTGS